MKIIKWGKSALRLLLAKMQLRGSLKIDRGKTPVYLGKGVRLMIQPGGIIRLGSGVYLDDYSRLQANAGATMQVGEYVYMNTNCRIVAAESVTIGAHTLFGPNVCVFDHDHIFDEAGVHDAVKASPIRIGERCWVAANSLVTRGVCIADKVLVGGGSVVTTSLMEPGVYVGAPCLLVRPLRKVGADNVQEDQEGSHLPQVPKCDLPTCDTQMASRRV